MPDERRTRSHSLLMFFIRPWPKAGSPPGKNTGSVRACATMGSPTGHDSRRRIQRDGAAHHAAGGITAPSACTHTVSLLQVLEPANKAAW